MSVVQRWIEAVRGPRALSLAAWWVLSILMLLRAVTVDFSGAGENALPADGYWTVARAIVLVAALMLIAGVSLSWLRRKREPSQPSVWLVIAIYVVIVVAASIVQGQPSRQAAGLVPVRIAVGVIALVVVAYVLHSRDQQRANLIELRRTQCELESLRVNTESELERIRSALHQVVLREVVPAIRRIAAQLQAARDDDLLSASTLHSMAVELRLCATNVVRALSHNIADSPMATVESVSAMKGDQAQEESPRIGWDPAQFARDFVRIAPFRTLSYAILMLLILTTALARYGTLTDVAFGLLALAICTTGMRVADRQLTPRFSSMSLPVNYAIFVGVYVLAAALTTVILSVGTLIQSDAEVALRLFGAFTALNLMVGIAGAVIAATSARSDRYAQQLSNAIAETRWQVDRLLADERALRLRVASALHTGVQARLVSAALRLDLVADHADSSSALQRQTIADALQVLTTTVDQVEAMASPENETPNGVRQMLDEIRVAWTNAVDVKIEISDNVENRIDESPQLARAVSDLVAEAVTNASRHGNARHIEIKPKLDDEAIVLSAIDDGIGPTGSKRDGLGLGGLDRQHCQWSLTAREGGVSGAVLTARLPLAQSATHPRSDSEWV